MAIENLKDRAFLNNEHQQAFTISGVDLTSRHVKWSMASRDALTGVFDPTSPDLQKTNQTANDMTDVNLTSGQITVNIFDSDTSALSAGEFEFQLEVFDSSGDGGVIVSAGVITFVDNITETV